MSSDNLTSLLDRFLRDEGPEAENATRLLEHRFLSGGHDKLVIVTDRGNGSMAHYCVHRPTVWVEKIFTDRP